MPIWDSSPAAVFPIPPSPTQWRSPAPSTCSPTEQQAAAGSADGTVFLWELAKSALAARLRDPKQHQPAVACAWCPLGLPLVSCDKAGAISFWTGRSSRRPSGSASGVR